MVRDEWLMPRPPETFEQACRLREELVMLTSQALLETDQGQLAMLIRATKARLDLLPEIRHYFDLEIRRLMTEVNPIAIDGYLFTPKVPQ